MFNCMLIDLKGMLTRALKWGTPRLNRRSRSLRQPGNCADYCPGRQPYLWRHHHYRIDEVLAPFVTASYNKHRKTQKSGTSRTPKATLTLVPSKVLRCLPVAGVRSKHPAYRQRQTPFVTFGFGLGTSWESRLIRNLSCVTVSPASVKTVKRRVPETGVCDSRWPEP